MANSLSYFLAHLRFALQTFPAPLSGFNKKPSRNWEGLKKYFSKIKLFFLRFVIDIRAKFKTNRYKQGHKRFPMILGKVIRSNTGIAFGLD